MLGHIETMETSSIKQLVTAAGGRWVNGSSIWFYAFSVVWLSVN